ncbi:ice-binding family protein [Spirosoma spitsbergense]|uniref:ice-binding family protein n=1 Tax=Spirosoma spitsbergense TaxID=431554 RepID=UPI000370EBB6|nr:ice-binding family protein [Spirosoma spitsbergense]
MRKTFLLTSLGVTLFALATTSFGQTKAPNLRSLTTFAFFTANGAFEVNGGATTVTGDVGTNVGAFNGFPPGTLIGNKRLPGSPEAVQAASDVLAAYNSITPVACDRSVAAELGGQTLTPGVSCQNTASPTTLNGTLTLSGSGIFIIKLNSALTTATNSNIVLTNGATANNVFFQVNGAFTAGTSSSLQGTFLVNGAIVLATGASLNGRGLSIGGAITLNANTVTNVAAPLPVSLVSFTAKPQANHTVDIAWTTSLETDNRGFVVERSKDLQSFDKVGEVGEIAANSKALKTYNLTDQTPFTGTSYYRLKQTDLNGKMTIYPAVSVVLRDEVYGLFPNPSVGDGRFTLRVDEPETVKLGFFSVDGRSLPLQKTGIQAGNLLLNTTGKLSTGIYILTVEERGQIRQHRLVVE